MSEPDDDMTLAVDEATFMENVREALSNGYELLCSLCGVGIYDDSDMHARRCPKYIEPPVTSRGARG